MERSKKRSLAQTPAPTKDKIYGSKVNKKGSASSESNAESIKLSDAIVSVLEGKMKEHNAEYPNRKVTLAVLKAVFRRGAGAYSRSHRPTISGGKPNSRTAWAYARVNKFLEKKAGKPVKKAYVQDDDLIGKYAKGGLVAPNGKKSNLTPEQYKLVRTKAFKAWFGDWENDPENASKVVDENGEPLVVYHGSKSEFNIFQEDNIGLTDRGWYGYGYYFSASPQMSDYYGKSKPYFIKIKNIFNTNKENPFYLAGKHVTESYINKGYDGSSSTLDVDKLYHEYCVFFPFSNNIKLADGSNTTFNGSNPDIRFEDGGEIQNMIDNGTIELKMYDTKPEHAEIYGLKSKRPLYFQRVFVDEKQRLNGLGTKILKYLDEYAKSNNHDLIFGHIAEKSEPNVKVIKTMLEKAGYTTIEGNNDFYKYVDSDNYQLPDSTKFMRWWIEWYKSIVDKFNIYISFPIDSTQFAENNVVILELFEKKDQEIDAKPYLNEIVKKADEYGTTIYLTPTPRYKYFTKDSEKGRRVTKSYLTEYYKRFGFELADGDYMKRLPKKKYHLGGDMSKHLAPNGKPSNLNHEQWHLVRTPEFKAWFGDWENDPENASKVVDDNGEPLVVYHGSRKAGFTVFDNTESKDRQSDAPDGTTFFTKDKSVAHTYSGTYDNPIFDDDRFEIEKQRAIKNGDYYDGWDDDFYYEIESERESGIYAVFLNIREPFEEDFDGANWDGDAMGKYELTDEDDNRVYDSKGHFLFDSYEEAESIAEAQGLENYNIREDSWIGYSTNSVAKEIGKYNDGAIIYNVTDDGSRGGYGGETTIYITGSPNQIKLADGTNTKFDKMNPDIRYEKGGEIKDLIVLHNINSYQIEEANKLGGLVTPSIAIVKAGNSFTDFGSITLIGTKELIDPDNRSVKVFAGDVYSPSVPRKLYYVDKKLLDKVTTALINKAYTYGKEIGDSDREIYSLVQRTIGDYSDFGKDLNKMTLDELFRQYYDKLKLVYIVDNSIKIKVPMKDKRQFLWNNFEFTLTQEQKKRFTPILRKYTEERNEKGTLGISKEIKDKVYDLFLEVKDDYKLSIKDKYKDRENPEAIYKLFTDGIDESFEKYVGKRDDWSASAEHNLSRAVYGEKVLDEDRLKQNIKKVFSKQVSQDYEKWLSDFITQFRGSAYFLKGNQKMPYTLNDLVDATSSRIVGQETNMTFGVNQAKSYGTKRLNSIADIKKNSGKLITKEEMSEIDKINKDNFFNLAEMLNYNGGTWDKLDSLGRALADYFKGSSASTALSRNDFKSPSSSSITLFEDFANELKNSPVDYFEAKYQRAVSLSEFKYAIVPKDTSKNVIEILNKNGLIVRKYANNEQRLELINKISSKDKSIKFAKGGKVAVKPFLTADFWKSRVPFMKDFKGFVTNRSDLTQLQMQMSEGVKFETKNVLADDIVNIKLNYFVNFFASEYKVNDNVFYTFSVKPDIWLIDMVYESGKKVDELYKRIFALAISGMEEKTFRSLEIMKKEGVGLSDAEIDTVVSFVNEKFFALENMIQNFGGELNFEKGGKILYHGSPYNFDEFKLSQIGTGEGVQAFGWGLYFTDLEDIAKSYAKPNIDNEFVVNGIDLKGKIPFDLLVDLDTAIKFKNKPQYFYGTQDAFEKRTIDRLRKYSIDSDNENLYEAFSKIRSFNDLKFKRNLYKVSLHKDKAPDEFTWLEWDKKPSRKIISKVLKGLDNIGVEYSLLNNEIRFKRQDGITMSIDLINGNTLYNGISSIFMSVDKEASLFLLRAGIDGIKYPAESLARGTNSDTARGFNYVVFDDDFVKIEDKQQFKKGGSLLDTKIEKTPLKGKTLADVYDLPELYELAEKYKMGLGTIRKEYLKGIEVEREHTNDYGLSAQIALNHLNEDSKYYTKLKKIKLKRGGKMVVNGAVRPFINLND